MESRVYAEDPFRNFLPSIGRLVKYRPPAETRQDGITVRNDTGVQEGGEISIHYDPMIAKLVTHAPSRAAAIEAQSIALDSFYVDGIRHNIPFLSALMNHPRWREGKLSTGFIAEEFPKGFAARSPEGEIARRLAAVGAAIDHVLGERKRQISGQMNGRVVQRERRRAVWLDREEIALDVAREADGIAVRFIGADGLPGNPHQLVSNWTPGEPVWQGTIDGHLVAMQVRAIPNGIRLAHQGYEVPVNVFTESEAAAARLMPVTSAADTGKKLLCPMPGLVVSIAVGEGQEVKAGETLAVVEAMKMQNVLRAERDGTVKKIHAAAGATLAVDALILEFATSVIASASEAIQRRRARTGLLRRSALAMTENRMGVIAMAFRQRREALRSILTGQPASARDRSMTRPRSASPKTSASRSACSAARWRRWRCSAIPTLRLITLTELAEQMRRMSRAASLPVLVDADHGYGNALNVRRTVQELEAAGAAGLTIEDTLLPQAFGRGEDAADFARRGRRQDEGRARRPRRSLARHHRPHRGGLDQRSRRRHRARESV